MMQDWQLNPRSHEFQPSLELGPQSLRLNPHMPCIRCGERLDAHDLSELPPDAEARREGRPRLL